MSLLTEIRDLLDADSTIAAKKKAAEEKGRKPPPPRSRPGPQRFATRRPRRRPAPGGPGFNARVDRRSSALRRPPVASRRHPGSGQLPGTRQLSGQFPEGEFPATIGPKHSR